ncbi:MAG: type III pantothenate kinase [Ignavibacteria bacterium]|nr:type III pantothenate kinase [Ignavibacteria bacterium]
MKGLLLDIGNSRFKGCITSGGKLSAARISAYRKDFKTSDFRKFVSEFGKYEIDFVYISNNDKLSENIFTKILFAIFGKVKIVFINKKTPLPVKIDYAESLGSDRICSAAGAIAKYGKHKNILVFDFGTATTVNLITNGTYKGGMIAAGLQTCADTLFKKTTLPEVSFTKKTSLINKDTERAIISGLIFQQAFFVNTTIAELKREFKNLYVVCTGGGLKFIRRYIKSADKFDDSLVMYGLNIIAVYNENTGNKK